MEYVTYAFVMSLCTFVIGFTVAYLVAEFLHNPSDNRTGDDR